MDVSSALSSGAIALGIVKDLRNIERDFEASKYKLKIAELHSAVAEMKMALTDACEEIRKLEAEIKTLKSGENCPLCDTGKMKITASKPHPKFAFGGVQMRTKTCQNSSCNHQEEHFYDPRKQ